VSEHPNHASLPYGVLDVLNSQKLAKPLHAYGLITVPSIPKYIGPVASLLAKIDIVFARIIPRLGIVDSGILVPVFVSGIQEYVTALKAMMHHRSQMVWFRWLNVAFSRYMWVNEWAEISPDIVGAR
jgi:N-acetylglucosaminylphosphatidylinositol deacetylase